MTDAREWLENPPYFGVPSMAHRMRDALLAVLDLHVETSGPSPLWNEDGRLVTWCAYCAELSNGEAWDEIRWPCSTVRAIDKALGVAE